VASLICGGGSFSLAIPVNASASFNGLPVAIRRLANWRISDEFRQILGPFHRVASHISGDV